MKRKRQATGIGNIRYAEYPFFGGVTNRDTKCPYCGKGVEINHDEKRQQMSRDAEIAELREANRITCEDIVVQQNLLVTYAEQIAELVAALEHYRNIADPADWSKNPAQEALAKVRKP